MMDTSAEDIGDSLVNPMNDAAKGTKDSLVLIVYTTERNATTGKTTEDVPATDVKSTVVKDSAPIIIKSSTKPLRM